MGNSKGECRPLRTLFVLSPSPFGALMDFEKFPSSRVICLGTILVCVSISRVPTSVGLPVVINLNTTKYTVTMVSSDWTSNRPRGVTGGSDH